MFFLAPAHGVPRHGGSLVSRLFSLMALKLPDTENTHFKVLRLLEINPKINQRELSSALGMSLGKVNYCLKTMLDKGMLEMQSFQGNKRIRAHAYLITPSGMAEKAALTGRFLQRKMSEYEQLKAEIESLQKETISKT